ncbi:MAG: FMN-binding glutamate synthase family protein [Deltaproteobacteria bacterium]|nr:FMN-binding glutamate synthase family protein [Deltaproteobacteria bacterium]
MPKLTVNLESLAHAINLALPAGALLSGALSYAVSPSFHLLTATLAPLAALNIYYRYGQKRHTLLANFGVLAQGRYLIESVGPELRQYLFASDTEERPFSRTERAEVYQKALGVDSASSFGTQLDYTEPLKLAHSMFPLRKDELEPFRLTFGEERGLARAYTLTSPILISGMSFGALGERAVRALSRGARYAGIPMNTGEGGYPKYHLAEGADLIFQLGTAKFGVRNDDGTLNDDKLRALCAHPQIKMLELKLSQGAKPGKGGILPKEKITPEIVELRGVTPGRDVHSPPSHPECRTPADTIAFIRHLQEVSGLPVGVKLCVGRLDDLRALAREMKRQGAYPDFITIDGAEGGTGAAPKSFMDEVGMPLRRALPLAHLTFTDEGVRDRFKLLASGKLISPGRQLQALALGADAVCSARGFMFAIGCIQALQCNKNSCPVGITTHSPHLQRGLDVELKARRVESYARALLKEHQELLAATGRRRWSELCAEDLIDLEAPAPGAGCAPREGLASETAE